LISPGARLLRFWNPEPAPRERVPVVRCGPARVARAGDWVRVLTWNLQYGGTRRHHFFYDGGDAVRVPLADVRDAVGAIGAVLRAADADLVFLQEVDRGSGRTGFVDQLAALQGGLGYPLQVSTPVHLTRFLPHPVARPLGQVVMHQCILSRVELGPAERIALPPLGESAVRRSFNLKRALLTSRVGGLRVGGTHLSAFSRGDGTLGRQVDALCAWAGEGGPWLLAGDFNLLPAGDDPARLGRDAREYADGPGPMAALLATGRSVVPAERRLEPAFRTYLPPGADAPDRALDHLFVHPEVETRAPQVWPVAPWVSDHLPLVAEVRLPKGR